MKVQSIGDWNGRVSFATDSGSGCPFVGIALGPNSDEGIVRLGDGSLLQAGRVSPLRERSYKVDRVSGVANSFGATKVLSLVMFEDFAELAAEVARPNGRYSVGAAAVSPSSLEAFTRVLTVPFAGRRQARITGRLVGDAAMGYRLIGRYWSDAERVVKEEAIQTVASNAGPTALSVMLGGTNEAACWDEVAVEVECTEFAAVCHFDVQTIGELGCR